MLCPKKRRFLLCQFEKPSDIFLDFKQKLNELTMPTHLNIKYEYHFSLPRSQPNFPESYVLLNLTLIYGMYTNHNTFLLNPSEQIQTLNENHCC